jgi:hypothetical protein
MLTIRNDQIQIFEKIIGFQNRMIAFCKEHFSLPYEMLGEDQIRNIIQYGMERAKRHGFEGPREMCIYISSMFLLGSDFDRDSQYPWVSKYLNQEEVPDPFLRVERLYDAILNYFDRVAGPENEIMLHALKKMQTVNFKTLSLAANKTKEQGIFELLTHIYPQKVQQHGRGNIEKLIQNGIQYANEYKITEYKNLYVYIGMMFFLCSGFDGDLQFPWASKILRDHSIQSENVKTEKLYRMAMILTNRILNQT